MKGQTSLEEYQQARADLLNEGSAPPTYGIECPICRNKGVIYVVKETEIVGRDCECMARRRAAASLVKSGFTPDMVDFTFDGYTAVTDWQQRAKDKAIAYTATEGSEWLYFSGQNGAGKTHLCTAVCKAFIDRGMTVQYVLWDELRNRIEANRFNESGYNAIFKELKAADVLYIDDFLKTEHRADAAPAPPTRDDLKAAYPVINARYMARKRTVISTEHYDSELNKYDTAIAGRISQRARGFIIQIARAADRDYRMQRHTGG